MESSESGECQVRGFISGYLSRVDESNVEQVKEAKTMLKRYAMDFLLKFLGEPHQQSVGQIGDHKFGDVSYEKEDNSFYICINGINAYGVRMLRFTTFPELYKNPWVKSVPPRVTFDMRIPLEDFEAILAGRSGFFW